MKPRTELHYDLSGLSFTLHWSCIHLHTLDTLMSNDVKRRICSLPLNLHKHQLYL